MHIKRAIIQNYRSLKNSTVIFREHLNIIVGNNETGKSTLLEAVNLALTGQLNGRSIYFEIHPFLFNIDTVSEFIEALESGVDATPPRILIELYLNDDEELARLRGTNNTLREDCPGISFAIEFDEAYSAEYYEYIRDASRISHLPVEYYVVTWLSFANEAITSRSIPIKPIMIDASKISNHGGTNKYVLDVVRDYLRDEEWVELSLTYRKMKDLFTQEKGVQAINEGLKKRKGDISEKQLSVSLDTTTKSSWEIGIMPHLDDIPLPLVGKGEQNSIKVKLAMDIADEHCIYLIEEPENHLSYSNLNALISKIKMRSDGKQLIITTHSSFVLNKLGVESVLLSSRDGYMALNELDSDTQDYFMKLPGHDTLRLILAEKVILVEGPSDELIVQRAFVQKYECMPLDMGFDVISVGSLAFKRFLEIAIQLKIDVRVVTDNDGDVAEVRRKYSEYDGEACVTIFYDDDQTCQTLEPQLLKANGLDRLNEALDTSYDTEEDLLKHMRNNKTNCALKLFNTRLKLVIPGYIDDAIQ